MNKFKKIAFIKFGGLSSGGTEVSFQNVAKSLSEKFSVDYYYCDSAPYIGSNWVHPDTDIDRQNFLEKSMNSKALNFYKNIIYDLLYR